MIRQPHLQTDISVSDHKPGLCQRYIFLNGENLWLNSKQNEVQSPLVYKEVAFLEIQIYRNPKVY